MNRWLLTLVALLLCVPATAQPEVPIEEWTGKKILLIGAHPDDDSMSHGTLAMLKANGNEIVICLITTGNVGTQDPDISRFELSQIRRQEQLDALKAIGISKESYINLGYDDGLLEFQDKQEVVEKLVRVIRTHAPDVLFAFDSGPVYRRWHKSDHRAAAYLAADATRVAMWRLLFEGQIIHEGLKEHRIPEFLFYDSPEPNTWVDITEYADQKVDAAVKYVSQFSSGWENYTGPELPADELAEFREARRERLTERDGKIVEGFRYYKGFPDSMGK
jgi:LmbE family N-acetylglucosaminyl deacetylase